MVKLAVLSLALTPTSSFAFQPPSALAGFRRSIALHEQPQDITAAPSAATNSKSSDWIKEEFEQVQQLPQKDDIKAGSHTSSKGLLDQGRIVGPARVLVYDTTLRGEF